MFDDNKMRKEICLDKCTNLGFKYFGLQATLVYMYIQRILDKTDLSGVGKSESELNTVPRTQIFQKKVRVIVKLKLNVFNE